MKNFKNIISFSMLLMIMAVYTSNVIAGSLSINQTFNYQGQLLDNGSPANGNYDLIISAFFAGSNGSVQGQVSEHLNTPVTNGLFTLTNVDIVDPDGVNPLDGLELFLEVAVKPAGTGSYTALSPRQSIKAVPYANNMARKGATTGQVLTFDGDGHWEPVTPSNGMLKYLVKATCTNDTQVIDSTFNGTTGSGSVTVSAFDINAGACRLTFPSGSGNISDLNNRYWVATAVGEANRIVTCQRNAARELDCRRTVASSGSANGGQFMVLVY